VSRERVFLDEFNAVAKLPVERAAAHSWKPLDLIEAGATPPAPPSIGGLLYPGRRHISSGEPDSLKSWAAQVLCVEEIRAERTVLYIDLEMGASMTLERLRALGLTEEEIRSGFLYVRPSEPMTDEAVLADVTRMVGFARPSLVVVDAFTGALELHGHDPVSGVAIEGFYRTVMAPLEAYGAASLLLDHVAKNRDARGKFAIDSQRKVGGVDVHLGFRLVTPFARGTTGLATITTHKDRPGHLPRPRAGELELVSDPDTFAVRWRIRSGETSTEPDPDTFRPTNLMEKVSRYLEQSAEPRSRNQIEQAVKGKTDFKRQAIDALIEEGYSVEVPGGQTRLVQFERAFRESDEWDGS
jgi:AAA domain